MGAEKNVTPLVAGMVKNNTLIVSVNNATPAMDLVTGIVIASDTPRVGEFACSDARVNQLYANIVWGQRGNYLSVPTDCPQRNERLGWLED